MEEISGREGGDTVVVESSVVDGKNSDTTSAISTISSTIESRYD